MKKILKKGKRGNRKARLVVYEEMKSLNDSSTRIELIQMLIPVGLQAIGGVTVGGDEDSRSSLHSYSP